MTCKEVKISNKTTAPAKAISSSKQTTKYELANGSTLLLTPNEVNDIIAISIFVKGGEFIEKIPGTANLTASVMTKGTKIIHRLSLRKFWKTTVSKSFHQQKPTALI